MGIHVASVIISGTVQPGTAFDPAVIAERYWMLHEQYEHGPGAWTVETVFDGKGYTKALNP